MVQLRHIRKLIAYRVFNKTETYISKNSLASIEIRVNRGSIELKFGIKDYRIPFPQKGSDVNTLNFIDDLLKRNKIIFTL